MFHRFSLPLKGVALLLCLTFTPTASLAKSSSKAPASYTHTAAQQTPSKAKATPHNGLSFDNINRGTKSKISDIKQWIKDSKFEQKTDLFINDMKRKTDRFQDRTKPVGKSIRAFFANKLPGKKLVQTGDRNLSAPGLLLIMALAFVIFLMTFSSPTSRLGGRH